MPVYDLYSKRRKRELGGEPDVFVYDSLPEELRRQIIHIWGDAIGIPHVNPTSAHLTKAVEVLCHDVVKLLRREYGLFKLAASGDPNNAAHALEELKSWFLQETNADRVLDAIELTFRVIDSFTRMSEYLNRSKSDEIASAAIEELNTRFREHGIGYEFSDGQIIRIDSKFVHAEAVIPTLTVLRRPEFATPQAEFLSAFEHFRHGNKPEVLVDCYKAFESTMKVICDLRKWPYDPKAAAKDLVKVCYDNGLIPSYWQTHFSGLRSVLESAISTPRNKQAGHGAGSKPLPNLPDELVSYVLHMTAATILFLSEAERKLP